MTELVGDDALQFVARQMVERPARHADGGVLRVVAGCEGVDGGIPVDDVAEGHRQAGGEGHLLDHVEVATFGEVSRVGADQTPAEPLGDGAAALGKLGDAQQAAAEDDEQRDPGGREEELRLEPIMTAPEEQLPVPHHREDVERAGQDDDRQHEQHDQLGRASAGLILGPEEIHRAGHGPWSALRRWP